MEKGYLVEDLLIGNLHTNQLIGGIHGFAINEAGPFFFYKQESEPGKKQRYKEIFEEEIKNVYKLSESIESQKFNKTYIVEVDDIKNYLTKLEIKNNIVSEYRLVEIYNNYIKNKREMKTNIIPIRESSKIKDKQIIKIRNVKEEKQVMSK